MSVADRQCVRVCGSEGERVSGREGEIKNYGMAYYVQDKIEYRSILDVERNHS